MSPPKPLVNSFLQRTNKPIVDPISKVFIIASLILGANRLPILGVTNTVSKALISKYITFICGSLFYLVIDTVSKTEIWAPFVIVDYVQYLIGVILGFVLHKRLLTFYLNLNNFDKLIGLKATKFGIRETVYNFLQLIVTLLHSATLYILSLQIVFMFNTLPSIPAKILNCFELHYYGHLFSLMIPRLKALSDCIKTTYPCKKNKTNLEKVIVNKKEKVNKKIHLDNTKKLIDFYNNIIVAHDSLNEAIKWQMLTLLISNFSIILTVLYNLVKTTIWGSTEIGGMYLLNLSMMIIQLLPLLVPCIFADRVQKEVRTIKDYLSCKLYENTLGKPGRSTARTLLALIETRDLSFSLFHMFDIDMSLPFKFMGLILTYLIILLQFNKVISPN